MNFSETLKACKDQKGYTIDELSRRSGVPTGTLSKLLSGAIAEPKAVTVLALAEALEVPFAALLDPDGRHVSETLSEEESRMIADYRRLDTHSRELVRLVMEKQLTLAAPVQAPAPAVSASEERVTHARILETPARCKLPPVPLYDLPVSAGVGEFLDSDRAERTVPLPESMVGKRVKYALRVSGNSMEPRFGNGDLLFIEETASVEREELGIFLLDGAGYFKKYMGDRLVSLNPDYADMPFSDYTDVRCLGRVVGHLARKKC